jgi:hypothetical protein
VPARAVEKVLISGDLGRRKAAAFRTRAQLLPEKQTEWSKFSRPRNRIITAEIGNGSRLPAKKEGFGKRIIGKRIKSVFV